MYKNLIKSKNVNVNITKELYLDFFKDKENEKCNYHEIILKFLTRMQSLILNNQILIKQKSDENFNKIKKNKKRKNRKQNEQIQKSEDDDISNINKSDNRTSRSQVVMTKSNTKSCLSDNDVAIKNKMGFLRVLKDVTKNMINEMKTTGLNFQLKLEPDILADSIPKDTSTKENNEIINEKIQSEVREETPNKEEELIIKSDDVKITFENRDCDKNTVIIPVSNNTHTPTDGKVVQTTNHDSKEQSVKVKKKGCKCQCVVF